MIGYRQYVLFLLAFCLMWPATSHSEPAFQDKAGLVVSFLKIRPDKMEPEFFYCWVDIEYFDNYRSDFCMFSISRFNRILDGFNRSGLPYDRSLELKTIVNQIVQNR